MKNEITNVSLSFCCKKDWNTFTSIDEQTRFCGSCEHRVVDFTNASAEELAKARQQDEKVCGRFTRSQMSTAFLNSIAAAAVVYSTVTSCSEPMTPVTHRSDSRMLGVLMGVPIRRVETHSTIKIVNDAGDTIAIVPMGGLE